jgi:hypothetical protein
MTARRSKGVLNVVVFDDFNVPWKLVAVGELARVQHPIYYSIEQLIHLGVSAALKKLAACLISRIGFGSHFGPERFVVVDGKEHNAVSAAGASRSGEGSGQREEKPRFRK